MRADLLHSLANALRGLRINSGVVATVAVLLYSERSDYEPETNPSFFMPTWRTNSRISSPRSLDSQIPSRRTATVNIHCERDATHNDCMCSILSRQEAGVRLNASLYTPIGIRNTFRLLKIEATHLQGSKTVFEVRALQGQETADGGTKAAG